MDQGKNTWKVDKDGKRYREPFPGCKEYVPTIVTTYGEFPVDAVPKLKPYKEPEPPKEWGLCPFFEKCSPDCARYTATGCGIVAGGVPNTGKRCPFNTDRLRYVRCSENCAMWALCNRKEQ